MRSKGTTRTPGGFGSLTRLGGYESEGRGTGRAAVIVAPSQYELVLRCTVHSNLQPTTLQLRNRVAISEGPPATEAIVSVPADPECIRVVASSSSCLVQYVTKEPRSAMVDSHNTSLPGLPSDGIHVQIGSQLPRAGYLGPCEPAWLRTSVPTKPALWLPSWQRWDVWKLALSLTVPPYICQVRHGSSSKVRHCVETASMASSNVLVAR
jgi:hypothetical protein